MITVTEVDEKLGENEGKKFCGRNKERFYSCEVHCYLIFGYGLC